MIPGKVFFQSINVSQKLSKSYEIILLLNGIYYDKIKLFQSNNDVLEVQLSIKHFAPDHPGIADDNRSLKIKEREQQPAIQAQSSARKQSYIKVIIPQTYKLVIQSKTIEVKFILNKKNKHQTINVNLAFQPVATFNRKKLGANVGINGKSISHKNIVNNNNSNHHKLAYFNNSSEKNVNVFQFNDGVSISSHGQMFPQELNFNKKEPFPQLQSPISIRSKSQTINQQNFLANKNYEQQFSKQRGFSKQKIQRSKTLNIGQQQEFSQTIKSQTFSDLFDKQINSSRTYMGGRQNIKISQDSNEESYRVNENDYHTEGNYNSSQAPSQLDTLESLAYQRQKILGELFGKFSHRNKK